ncbi:conserved hypothetical protein [Verticillium alfalfae VaMs.102]|uniref:Uncharacterized protein n=1 Tax=Verticillium alfalfae (strain VaMs.102 / ATCC MYA-4576 / FGSC 10136) TaxID=526221 RepID=C9S854_VERA1|nr:conserved hypothetical protein [Verticillium alfalfae VaMs.102]EEY14900.1 conserved hypothetical protein [Verticillium alfalfae VaMs.102]
MRYSLTLIAFAVTALALPTAKPADDGSWAPGKYEGPGTPYDDGKWYPGKYPGAKEKRADDGSWAPGKYEGAGTPYDDGKWYPGKYPGAKEKRADDGKWAPGKYEGAGTPYDDGKWYPGKYPGAKAKRADDGKWAPGKYEGPGTPYDDGKWYPGNIAAILGTNLSRTRMHGIESSRCTDHCGDDNLAWLTPIPIPVMLSRTAEFTLVPLVKNAQRPQRQSQQKTRDESGAKGFNISGVNVRMLGHNLPVALREASLQVVGSETLNAGGPAEAFAKGEEMVDCHDATLDLALNEPDDVADNRESDTSVFVALEEETLSRRQGTVNNLPSGVWIKISR